MYRSTHYLLASWVLYFVVGMAGLLTGPAHAQEAHPCHTRNFKIPYSIENNGVGLSTLYLYVSRDGGKVYTHAASVRPAAAPENRFFVYNAPADGEYWFVVQTRDNAGGLQPLNPATAPPSLKVLVDTQKPRILDFKQVAPQDGSRVAVEWTVEDDNFASVFLEYRAQGTNESWIPVPTPTQSAHTVQGFTPVIGGPLDVHLRVQDKGGNTAEQDTTVDQTPGRQTAQAPRQGLPPDSGPPIMHVKSKTFRLDYSFDEASVGPSGIKHVEIHTTHDEGRSWQQAPQPAPPKGPCEFTVASPGRWGFILVPVSGVGLSGEKPRPGDVAQLWVEVDENKPMVTLMGAPVVGKGADTGYLIINWKASDKNLRRDGITISYRVKPDDPWTPLPGAERLPGTTTTFRALTQGLPYQFFIQVKAVDEAGNEGEAVTDQPIKVDLTVPRIKNLVVQPAVSATEPHSPYSP